jgi:hypothetical protein
MADIELSNDAAKKALLKINFEPREPKWAPTGHRNRPVSTCAKCQNNTRGIHYNVNSPPITGWVCRECWNSNQSSTPKFPDGNHVNQMLKELISSTNSSRSSKASAATRKQNTIAAKAQPYVDMGLGLPFAEAIAKDLKLADSVMDLWEAEWWKQYEVDDILIVAVLEGVILEEDGKWLNTIRSDHEDLVLACIAQHCPVDWARALMDCGLESHSQAVTSVLQGGEPGLVARIADISVNSDLVPPSIAPFEMPDSHLNVSRTTETNSHELDPVTAHDQKDVVVVHKEQRKKSRKR